MLIISNEPRLSINAIQGLHGEKSGGNNEIMALSARAHCKGMPRWPVPLLDAELCEW